MTHSEPASPEHLPVQRYVQDVDIENYYVPDSSGRLVCLCQPKGCLISHSGCPAAQEVPSVCLWRKGLPVQGSSLWPGLGPVDVHKVNGCCSDPFEAPGYSCTQLSGGWAHTGPLHGVSELSQRYRPPPHSCSWPQNKYQKECSHPFSTNCVFGGSLGFRSNACPSGSCLDFQFQRMFGPLQARPSCLCEHLSQAPRAYGRNLPCATSRIAPHEIIPLVDEIVEDPLHRTSHSPNQGVAQLLSHPLNMAKPHFSPEWSQHGWDSPSPHGYDGHIIDRLGRGLRRQTSARCLDRRVPLLAHTLPGAQSRLPGTDSLSPPSQRVSCDSQDTQHDGGILHKSQREFTVAHPEQACTPSSPLVSEQVPLPESSLCSGSFEPGGRFSIEAGGMDAEPSVSSPDLGSIRQSGSGPLSITRVVPMPALVLPEFPGTSGHRRVCSSLAERETVRVSASKANSCSPVQGEGEWCPSPTRSPILAISDVVL